MKSLARTIAVAFLAALSPLAAAAPCAGFTDVDDSSPFCADVTWIANRGVTLGCDVGLYCPNAAVTRLSMAVFLRRLGETVYERQIATQFTQTSALGAGASETVFTFGWPVDWHVVWRAVATSTGGFVAVSNVAVQTESNGSLTYFITVHNQGGAATGYAISYAVLR